MRLEGYIQVGQHRLSWPGVVKNAVQSGLGFATLSAL